MSRVPGPASGTFDMIERLWIMRNVPLAREAGAGDGRGAGARACMD